MPLNSALNRLELAYQITAGKLQAIGSYIGHELLNRPTIDEINVAKSGVEPIIRKDDDDRQ